MTAPSDDFMTNRLVVESKAVAKRRPRDAIAFRENTSRSDATVNSQHYSLAAMRRKAYSALCGTPMLCIREFQPYDGLEIGVGGIATESEVFTLFVLPTKVGARRFNA